MLLRGTVSVAQAQGPRESQEDYLVQVPFKNKNNGQGHLLGVMDGHSGKDVAEYCAKTIPRLFNLHATSVAQELHRVVAELGDRTRFLDAGSTLSLVCVNETRCTVTTAILGDSPVVVVDVAGKVLLSEEHNVRTNIREREAVLARGGVYRDGYIFNAPNNPYGLSHEDGLQLSRALGDHSLRWIMDQTPAVSQYALGAQSVVVIGSDGLFDPSHEQSRGLVVREILTHARKNKGAYEVLRWRESFGLQDNTTVIVWVPQKWWQRLF